MKRWLLAAIVLLVWATLGFCTDNASNIGSNRNVDSAVVVADLSNGYLQKIDAYGTAKASEGLQTIGFTNGRNGGQGLVYTGPATVYGFVVTGTVNNDYAQIYDAVSKTGTPILDIVVSASNPTAPVQIPGGRHFNTGIFVELGTGTVHTATIYNPD